MPFSTFTAEAYPIAGLSRDVTSPLSGLVTEILVGRTLPSVPTTSKGVLIPLTTSRVSPCLKVSSLPASPLFV